MKMNIKWEWAACWLLIFAIILQIADAFFSKMPFTDQRWALMIEHPMLLSLLGAFISACIAVIKDIKGKVKE